MKNIHNISQIMASNEGNRLPGEHLLDWRALGSKSSDLLDMVSRRGISQPRLDSVRQYI